MPKRTFTAEQRAEYRQAKQSQAREQVERSVRELLTSDGWAQWIQTRVRFRRYSPCNSMLIAMQCPDATAVAGFRRWQELGRQVRKGEHGIRIFAPMTVKDRESEDENARKVIFHMVSVFDVGQTDGDPLPAPPSEPITGDSHTEYLPKLTELAHSLGLTVEESGSQSYHEPAGKRIVIAADLAPNAKVRALVHELAHAHGVTYDDYPRAEAEVIVDSAAMIVCGSIGLDTSGESVPYLAGWGEAGDLDAIKKHAETVDRIARSIEDACGLGKDQ